MKSTTERLKNLHVQSWSCWKKFLAWLEWLGLCYGKFSSTFTEVLSVGSIDCTDILQNISLLKAWLNEDESCWELVRVLQLSLAFNGPPTGPTLIHSHRVIITLIDIELVQTFTRVDESLCAFDKSWTSYEWSNPISSRPRLTGAWELTELSSQILAWVASQLSSTLRPI